MHAHSLRYFWIGMAVLDSEKRILDRLFFLDSCNGSCGNFAYGQVLVYGRTGESLLGETAEVNPVGQVNNRILHVSGQSPVAPLSEGTRGRYQMCSLIIKEKASAKKGGHRMVTGWSQA